MKAASIDLQIQEEIQRIPAALRSNFLVRAAINSREELGAEGQLEQLQEINRQARRRVKAEGTPTVQLSPLGAVRAGKKKNASVTKKRKAN